MVEITNYLSLMLFILNHHSFYNFHYYFSPFSSIIAITTDRIPNKTTFATSLIQCFLHSDNYLTYFLCMIIILFSYLYVLSCLFHSFTSLLCLTVCFALFKFVSLCKGFSFTLPVDGFHTAIHIQDS